jgi:predicted phosphodiesterase
MIVAVFGDVHANLPALEAFETAVRDVAEGYLCLGDIVDYGPWNDECLERIAALPGIQIVAGNHDRLFLDDSGLDREAPVVQEFYRASRASFTRMDLLRGLPDELTLGPFRCTHTIGERRVFADTQLSVDSDYLIGHTHWQYSIRRGRWRIINPGSVGQNREQINMVDYALYDTESDKVTFARIPYDISAFLAELRARNWPAPCLGYYARKLAEAGERA